VDSFVLQGRESLVAMITTLPTFSPLDDQSFKDIEEYGVKRWLDELAQRSEHDSQVIQYR
jgi:hypothetical protein